VKLQILSAALTLAMSAAALANLDSTGDAELLDAGDQSEQAPKTPRKLAPVIARGMQPSSLPTRIPTTIEGISGAEIERKINATDAEDALKYFPSLVVRKRYIGDYDHAVLASRASGTGNSARSLVYADGILLSNLLGNGASFTPRWGLVTPEEIERVDVLYGPFSAAYPGNSVGAVVDYVTRMPQQFEAHAKLGYYLQDFSLYGSDDRFASKQGSASIGSRSGALSWWININRLDSEGHPLVFATRLNSVGVTTAGGTPVSGAVQGLNPRNQPWLLLGATNQIETVQDHAKLKLAYDLAEDVRLSYTLGLWQNDVFRDSLSYLRDANGNPVYSGNVRINDLRYTLNPADISLSRAELEHVIHGLSLKSNSGGHFDYALGLSLYDYRRDLVRSPSLARPQAESGGAGRIADGDGTGWTTLSLAGTWRPGGDRQSAHIVDFGLQSDRYELQTEVFNTDNWINGAAQARFSAFAGETRLQSVYLQDTWALAERWTATLGARLEDWDARDGLLGNATTEQRFPARDERYISPKAALEFAASEDWVLRGSAGRAVRFPTVSELYQGTISTNVIINNDPNLQPERSWTGELTALRTLRTFGDGTLRTTLFVERTSDALYSQTNVTVTPNVTNIQNVDRIKTRGLELAWQASGVWIDSLDLSASLTFADSEITRNDNAPSSVGKRQPRVPRWRGNLLASWQASERWSLTGGARYSGTQFNTLDNSDPNGDAYTGNSRYLVFDVRAQYRHNEHWSGSLGVDNIGDQQYWAFHPYPQRSFSAELRYDY
jgi:iron complex outermembrane receptor protein